MPLEKKLFFVKFKMRDFTDAQGKVWKDVPITLFVGEEGRKPLIPFEVGIKDYDGSDPIKEHALTSLFSEDEASRLVSYLRDNEGLEAEIDEAELPIDSVGPWYGEMDPAYEGFIGVSTEMCSHTGLGLAAYFNLRGSATWDESK